MAWVRQRAPRRLARHAAPRRAARGDRARGQRRAERAARDAAAMSRFLRRRSGGIRDLRRGSLVDEDWQDRDPDALRAVACQEIPLLEGANTASSRRSRRPAGARLECRAMARRGGLQGQGRSLRPPQPPAGVRAPAAAGSPSGGADDLQHEAGELAARALRAAVVLPPGRGRDVEVVVARQDRLAAQLLVVRLLAGLRRARVVGRRRCCRCRPPARAGSASSTVRRGAWFARSPLRSPAVIAAKSVTSRVGK